MADTDDRLGGQLGAIAARLIDIAGCVASEAEAATAVMRGTTGQAHRIAQLAAALAEAAAAIEEGARRQTETLAHARATLAINKPVIDALTRSASPCRILHVKVRCSASMPGLKRRDRAMQEEPSPSWRPRCRR